MVDKGPLLTSAIIFYLSIGAAIFQVLEEPNWKKAVEEYQVQKHKILKEHPCLSLKDLDRILEVNLQSNAGIIHCCRQRHGPPRTPQTNSHSCCTSLKTT